MGTRDLLVFLLQIKDIVFNVPRSFYIDFVSSMRESLFVWIHHSSDVPACRRDKTIMI